MKLAHKNKKMDDATSSQNARAHLVNSSDKSGRNRFINIRYNLQARQPLMGVDPFNQKPDPPTQQAWRKNMEVTGGTVAWFIMNDS
jgi:hypothetical protein